MEINVSITSKNSGRRVFNKPKPSLSGYIGKTSMKITFYFNEKETVDGNVGHYEYELIIMV